MINNINWQGSALLFKTNNTYKGKVVGAALVKALPNFDLNDGNYTFDPVSSHYITQAGNLEKRVQMMKV